MGALTKAGTISIPHYSIDTVQLRQFVFGPRPHRTLCRVLVWCALTLTFFHHLLVPIQIIGSSMSPTYQNGSLNLVNRFAYTKKQIPKRGDVVAISVDGELLLKRIVAVPGEIVAIENGAIHIDGRRLSDEFSFKPIPWEMEPLPLQAEEYFVIGDNRAASIFCKVPRNDIVGKVMF